MPRTDPLTKAQAALRDHAMTYPQAAEDFPWGHLAVKVKGKAFVFLALFDDVLSMSAKLPVSATWALSFPFAKPTEYGLGKHGWVTCKFAAGDAVPVELLSEWIDESYRAVAPKKVVAQLEAGEEAPPPKARGRKKRPAK
jgi:predicted DNA-binding protein (MmcQ/YjbR family)